ncbi:hypothetical protein BX616_008641 [Lobosporangium transversale]|uniref:EF-hand domain-containing protein n=1 Tax=Lobosporangium transversale TaxID=64571 RepID=A0A1Y2GX58_9FUNG|nr:hypothetical protein BCR41DRAFT_346995 [Lobosporangium transversale]KAF9914253.1 hypothetical protein BX616_008641 [Lobosporangium transversale]ORZ26867.1 hypothetical protein BCR41DRAFT_346995 [Lobosporangium transversale]|eukprot:XP_021884614.1 hypothetical protein BCR41DRAFT_346995 [Lobosporangium transversale]
MSSSNKTFDTLTEDLIEILVSYLEPLDMVNLGATSKRLYKEINQPTVWEHKAIDDFGDRFTITSILNSAGLDLGEQNKSEPTDWREYYKERHQAISKMNKDGDSQIAQSEKDYEEAQELLRGFQASGEIESLSKAAQLMVGILDNFPGHAGCYHLLGFTLYVLNELEDALSLLEIGSMVDPNYEPIKELTKEIHALQDGYGSTMSDAAPLLDNAKELSAPLKAALTAIFNSFDKDRDGSLSPTELSDFVYRTNGSRPPTAFLTQMGIQFGKDAKGYLTLEGFFNFFLEQTLEDPIETRRDLERHGYDGDRLVRCDVARNA